MTEIEMTNLLSDEQLAGLRDAAASKMREALDKVDTDVVAAAIQANLVEYASEVDWMWERELDFSRAAAMLQKSFVRLIKKGTDNDQD